MTPNESARVYGESPIERKFLWALMEVLGFRAHLQPRCYVADLEEIYAKLPLQDQTVIVAPQAQFGSYRTDVALLGKAKDGKLHVRVVECDGADFHSSESAIERDRRRDEFMKQWGASVIRFPGSRIHRASDMCALEACIPFINKHWSNAPALQDISAKFGIGVATMAEEPLLDVEDGEVVIIEERMAGDRE